MKLNGLIILATLFTAACSDMGAPTLSVAPNALYKSWQVQVYEHPEKDLTAEAESIQLEFRENGELILTDALNTNNGTWSFEEDASKLVINLEGSKFSKDISTTWLILRLDNVGMKLISDEVGPHQYLLLEPQQL